MLTVSFTATTSTLDVFCHVTLSAFSFPKGTNPIPSASPCVLCFLALYVLTAFPGFSPLPLHLQEKVALTTGCRSSSLLQTCCCLVIFSPHIESLHLSFPGTAIWTVPDGISFGYLGVVSPSCEDHFKFRSWPPRTCSIS